MKAGLALAVARSARWLFTWGQHGAQLTQPRREVAFGLAPRCRASPLSDPV
jgi:hypothetical protein